MVSFLCNLKTRLKILDFYLDFPYTRRVPSEHENKMGEIKVNKDEQVRKAIEEIAAENDKDFGKRGWVNLSLLSNEIQAYMQMVMGIEMSVEEIEEIEERCDYVQLINDLKLGR